MKYGCCKILICLCFTLMTISLRAEKINVRIFADTVIKQASFTASFGLYSIQLPNDTTLIELNKTSKVTLKNQANKVSILINDSLVGAFSSVTFLSSGLKSFFLLTPFGQPNLVRRYDDNLTVSATSTGLKLINNVEMENYVAAVVQAESGGATDNVEFFKVQALCVRNYLYSNFHKHQKDGYQMCDGVNCQAYKGRANKPEVIEGTYNSQGEVIVDSLGTIIETLFHANSGGQTVSAIDVWGKGRSYLQGKVDTFSVAGKGYKWEKYIQMKEWKRYFKNKGIDLRNDSIENILVTFSQDSCRQTQMLGVSLIDIRKDFSLRSTRFTCQAWGSEVKLNGYGYGHGVGMSQEGAIRMCDDGYDYRQVIEFYYTGAKVKQITDNAIIN